MSDPVNITALVGKRCLLRIPNERSYLSSGGVSEYRVIELSPSGHWVKLQSPYGNKFWRPVTDLALIEELKEIKPEKPPQA